MTMGGDRGATALDAVAAVAGELGVGKRPLRQALALLTERRQTADDLVRACALPRRTVDALLRAAAGDLDADAGGFLIGPDLAEGYRERFALAELGLTRLSDPFQAQLAAHAGLVRQAGADIAAAPAARAALDHVAATAQTVVRRALWLNATFDLAGARLLCIGDHDLSSLAACALIPGLAVTVVDVDERLLEFIGGRAAERGHDIRCRYADLRFGLPGDAAASADVVLTDPPYTPEGVLLFLGRGVQGLRDRRNGRLVMAYGFSPLHPALGMKVQRAVQELDLVAEAILPGFNRYHGAQAVGSASDLYVLRPTARTFQVLDRALAARPVQMYTRGAQSLEGASGALDPAVAAAVTRLAAGADDGEPSMLVGPGWPQARNGPGSSVGPAVCELWPLFASGMPAAAGRLAVRPVRPIQVAVNLADDPGPWLLRTLLAINADHLALLVPNNQPDLAGQQAQRALADLIAAKYALRLRRSTPTAGYAVVEATAVPAGHQAAPVARELMLRAHGKVGNVWREAMIRRSADGPRGPLTKGEARARIAAAVTRQDWLDARLIDLPRHAIAALLAEAEAS